MITKFVKPQYFQQSKTLHHSQKNYVQIDYKVKRINNGEAYSYYQYGEGKRVLFLLHTNTATGYFFNKFSSLLVDKFRVIAPNLRGFGHTTMKTPFRTHKQLSDDVLQLATNLKIDRFDLLGWGMGGAVAMAAAATEPERIINLVLMSSMLPKGQQYYKFDKNGNQTKNRITNAQEMSEHPKANVLYSFIKDKKKEELKEMYRKIFYNGIREPAKARFNNYMEEVFLQRSYFEALNANNLFNFSKEGDGYAQGSGKMHAIRSPILMINGSRDLIVPQDQAQLMQQEFGGDRATLKMFENSGHVPFEDYPMEVADLIKDFCFKGKESIKPEELFYELKENEGTVSL